MYKANVLNLTGSNKLPILGQKKKKKKRETDWPKVSDFAIYVKHGFYIRAHAAKETYKTNTLGDYFV